MLLLWLYYWYEQKQRCRKKIWDKIGLHKKNKKTFPDEVS